MNTIMKQLVVGALLCTSGSMLATEFYLLNKTPKPLYYKLGYQTVGQDLLSIPAVGVQDQKMQKWFDEQLEPKIGEGVLAPNQVAHVKSYRLSYLVLSETRPEKQERGVHRGQIVSFAGDKRILDACQTRKQSDCVGTTLKDIKPEIATWFDASTMSTQSAGYIRFHQKGLTNLAVPLVVVATFDPKRQAQGKVGYIVTELAHTWGVKRTPKSFFFELQGQSIPSAKK